MYSVPLPEKIYLLCSQKPTDKYNQAVVGWCKASQSMYPQFFVVIGMVVYNINLK